MIDLQPFCGTEETRPYLMKPFSCGEFTYATNGHVCVRVPRRDGALEGGKIPDVTKLSRFFDLTGPFEPATIYPLPPVEFDDCDSCDGRCTEHDCPDCKCACVVCEGTGRVSSDHNISASVLDHPFNLKYVRLLFALPELKLAMCELSDADAWMKVAPLAFRFDGGEGLLMSMVKPFAQHIDPSKDDGMGASPQATRPPETNQTDPPGRDSCAS